MFRASRYRRKTSLRTLRRRSRHIRHWSTPRRGRAFVKAAGRVSIARALGSFVCGLAFVFVFAVAAQLLSPVDASGDIPTATVTPRVPPTPPPITPIAGDVFEGTDFSLKRAVDGSVLRWSCNVPIDVTLVGPTPEGAEAAVRDVVEILAAASGLSLRYVSDSDATRRITVEFAPLGSERGGLSLPDEQTLGIGGPTYSRHDIISGNVLIRNDAEATRPDAPTFRVVIAHEIAHALGLGHAAPGSRELMAPQVTAPLPGLLGPGDEEALREVGCQ